MHCDHVATLPAWETQALEAIHQQMKYDYVIVGAGAAGAILASRLTEDPDVTVLLLEAGPDYPDIDLLPDEVKYGYGTEKLGIMNNVASKHRWTFVARATDDAVPMLVPRGRVTGGSTAINAMIFLRGVPDDYDRWASWGNDKWSFQQLLPSFRKLETDTDYADDFHGTDGPIIVRRFKPDEWLVDEKAFYDACRAYGFSDCPDHNDPDSTGVGPTPFNHPNRIRWSTNIGYLGQARHRLNLTIRGDCLVHRLVFDGNRAAGVEVESGDEVFTAYGNEVVLSGGPIGSPQILLLSGVGPSHDLNEIGIPVVHELPGVGQNLRDHPQVQVLWRTIESFDQDITAPRLQFTLRYTATGSEFANDMLVHPISAATGRLVRGGDPTSPVGIGMTCTLDLAMGSGELRLRSDDPGTQPFLDYNFLEEEFDRQRLREAVRICVKLAEHQGLSEIIDERIHPDDATLGSDEALDSWMMREVTTSHHISGTCKMGPESDPMAVVDQFGKVHGLRGLRVVDASIMPDCTRANTNVTTMMIGERVAEMIKQGN